MLSNLGDTPYDWPAPDPGKVRCLLGRRRRTGRRILSAPGAEAVLPDRMGAPVALSGEG